MPFLIGIKNARVKIFSGRCLGPGDGFRYQISPQSQQAEELSSWYERQDDNVFARLPYFSKVKSDSGSMGGLGNTPIMSLAEGLEMAKGKAGKAEFFAVSFRIFFFSFFILFFL